jgi:opacity protein-like surface antigen
MLRKLLLVEVIVLCHCLGMSAQENRSEISVQGTGLFTKATTGNDGTAYSATKTGGFLGTYRFHFNKRFSAEAAYGFNINTEKFLFSSSQYKIQSGIHQVTGSLVINLPSRPTLRLSPYVLAGGGALVFAPTGNRVDTLSSAQTQAKAAFVYGAGVNYAIRKQLSLRVEYRGFLYTTPDFGYSALRTNSITHTAQPSVGITFRF